MRSGAFFIVIAVVAAAGCSKKSDTPASAFAGKWQVLMDTTVAAFGPEPVLVIRPDYMKDTWDFSEDGTLYIQEGTFSDVEYYKVYAKNSIVIARIGWSPDAAQAVTTIERPLPGEMIIRTSNYPSAGGGDRRVVYLIR